MGIILFNPTELAEKLIEENQDDGLLIMTGVLDLSRVEVYGAIMETLDSDAIRYGYSLPDGNVIMAVEHMEDYVEELTSTLMELTGVEELDLAPLKEFASDDVPIPSKYYGKSASNLKSTLDDDEDEIDDLPDDFSVEEIIPEHIYTCLNSCLKVLTGSHTDIKTNEITL